MVTISLALVVCSMVSAGPQHDAELIFPQNPQHNHGSSIVQTPDGGFLACWFHGTGERNSDDVMVQGARKRPGESKWSEPFVMADTPDLPDCNPVLFIDPRKTLWLFWITVQDNEWGGSLLKYRTATEYSKDGAPAWNWQDVIHARPNHLQEKFAENLVKVEAKYGEILKKDERRSGMLSALKKASETKLPSRLGWMTRLHPIMTSDSRMMLGLYSDVFNCGLATFTEDWGKTWQFSEPILSVDLGNIQPSFVKKKNGNIVVYMRDNGFPKKIRRAESTDAGKTWGPVEPTEIMNPGSSVECISLKNGHWVMVCNDAPKRNIISAYLSDDEGATWKWHRRLENFQGEDGSGSYPSVIQTTDDTIHCTYSFVVKEIKGSTIKHAWFNEDWIKEGDKQ